MKQSSICPKCKSTTVVKIANMKTAAGNYIQLNIWGTQIAYFDRYICNDCGYMEQYIDVNDKGWQKWYEKQLEENTLDSDFV